MNLPFGAELQDQFPLVGCFLHAPGQAAVSRLSPERVANVIGERFGA